VVQSDADTSADAEPFDDPAQGDVFSLRTGVGCTTYSPGTPEPLLLLMLLMAFGCLKRNNRDKTHIEPLKAEP